MRTATLWPLLALAAVHLPAGVRADEVGLPGVSAAHVRDEMQRVADWQLARLEADVTKRDGARTGWIQGVFYTGVLAVADVTADPRYHDALLEIGGGNNWHLGRQHYDADDQCVGQLYVGLFLKDHRPEMIENMTTAFDAVMAHPKDGNLEFDRKRNPGVRSNWSWCDALFMAPPAWVRLSAATGNRAYLDFAVRNWWHTSEFLYDRDEHLFFRDSSYFSKREPNGQKVFWARGNGWVLAGLARMLQFLPPDHPDYARFERQFREIATRVVALQQPDGFWRVGLLDAADYPEPEESGTGLFCYALAWGINHGTLDRATFGPAVAKAWAALERCVTPDGRVIHVQPVGSHPTASFAPDSTTPYGAGAFLLAGSEVYRLCDPDSRRG